MSKENHDFIQETEPTFTIKQLQKYSLETVWPYQNSFYRGHSRAVW